MDKQSLLKTALSSFMLISLTACGSSPSSSEKPASASSPADPDETEPAETVPAEEESTVFAGKGTTEETVLVDEADIKITASELTYNEYAAMMDLTFENNTDKRLVFYGGSGMSRWDTTMTVNGWAISEDIYEDIKPGETKTEELYIRNDDLNFFGITDIAELGFRFIVLDREAEEIYLATDPLKIPTSSASSYDLKEDTFRKAVKDGRFAQAWEAEVKEFVADNFYAQDGVNITSALLVEKDSKNYVLFEVENTTDEIRNLSWRQFGVNGLILQKTWKSNLTLDPGSRAVLYADPENMIYRDGLESLGISDITTAFFTVRLIDANEEPLSEETIVTIPFKDEVLSGREGEELYSNNGIRVIRSGIEDTQNFYNILLTVFNDTPDTISVKDSGKYLLVNGLQNAQDNYNVTIAPGQAGVMKVGLRKTDSSIAMDANDITPEQIETIETSLKLFKDGDDVWLGTPFDQPEIVMHLK
ncbi:MAG: hypothetical protein Q4D46_12920 [Erysipelotrichaceae bacterium]|nr:hypothetical protein [Erysipelotrichaceae bacterium]